MNQINHTKTQKNAKAVTTKSLVKKALKNGFKCKVSPGKKYLKDLIPGSIFKVYGLTGILVETTPTASKVIIIECKISDSSYYLGKQSISGDSEVIEVSL